MAIQQGTPNTGYRDPMKAMTIKALQERQKAAALAAAKAQEAPAQMPSPWQGVSHLAGVLGSGYTQGRADSAEADARTRLAALKAQINPETGATQQQIADMSVLDPEFADKEYERAMAERAAAKRQEDQQQFQTSERIGGQEFTAGQQEDTQRATAEQNELNRLADIERQKLADAQASGRQEDAQKATVELARLNAELDAKKAADAETAKVAAVGAGTEARKAEWLKLNPNGDINSDEAQSYILRDAAPATGGFGGPAGIKAMQDFQHEANGYSSGLDAVNEAKALIPKALTGDIGRKVAEYASAGGEAGIGLASWLSKNIPGLSSVAPEYANISREQIEATKRLYAIMDRISNLQMSGTLKGASTDREMANFQRIFADPGATPEMKMQAIMELERSFSNDRDILSGTIQSAGGEALRPYSYVPIDTGMGTPAPAPDAAAPAPAGGGGGNEYKEGDVVSSPGQPDLVLRNGQWVPVK